MFRLAGSTAVGSLLCCFAAAGIGARAATDAPDNRSFLYFAGSDLWFHGAFLNGGMLWSPAGLARDGFTFKALIAGGGYDYPTAGRTADIDGTLLSASALAGYRWSGERLTVDLFAGPIAQDYKLTPDDPNSRLRGRYLGGQFAADVWYQPNPATMLAFDTSIASISLIGSARAAFGSRLFGDFYVGPEMQALWCVDYQQFRLGVHATAFKISYSEWFAAAGLAAESDRRWAGSPYLRIGVSLKN
jgi:hypothetical protein